MCVIIFFDYITKPKGNPRRKTMKNQLPYVKQACSNCPFRKSSVKGWLGEDRMKEIVEAESFVCHKTIGPKQKQCAGHIAVSERNIFSRLALSIGIDIASGINKEPLFEDGEAAINHHCSKIKEQA